MIVDGAPPPIPGDSQFVLQFSLLRSNFVRSERSRERPERVHPLRSEISSVDPRSLRGCVQASRRDGRLTANCQKCCEDQLFDGGTKKLLVAFPSANSRFQISEVQFLLQIREFRSQCLMEGLNPRVQISVFNGASATFSCLFGGLDLVWYQEPLETYT